MHASGSMILTIAERVRGLLDEPSLDAKYTQDLLVRHHLTSAFVDVLSRINNTTGSPIINRMSLVSDFVRPREFRLPPCVQEVVRLLVTDSDGQPVQDMVPRDRMDWRGPGWQLEGSPGALTLRVTEPLLAAGGAEIWYVSNSDMLPHYSTAGSASSYQVAVATADWTAATRTLTKTGGFTNYTFRAGDKIKITAGGTVGDYDVESRVDDDNIVLKTSISASNLSGTVAGRLFVWFVDLATTPTLGQLDRRESSYIGQMFRYLPTGATDRVQEAQITEHVLAGSAWRVKLRFPIDVGATPGTLTYEVVPAAAQALADAVACQCALRMGVGVKISETHRSAIAVQYRTALKTIGDNMTNIQTVMPKSITRGTVNAVGLARLPVE